MQLPASILADGELYIQMSPNGSERPAWLDEEKPVDDKTYEIVTCPACTRMHLINRSTGKPLGYKDDSPPGGQKK